MASPPNNKKSDLDARMTQSIQSLLPYALAILLACALVGFILFLMGKNVIQGYSNLFLAPFQSPDIFGLTMLKFIPLALLGLAFAIPFKLRAWNLGLAGQFLLGATGAALIAIILGPITSYAAVPLLLVSAATFGAIWALVPALLLYKFGVTEMVSTILMSFISYNLVDYIATGSLRDVGAGSPMTIPIPQTFLLPNLAASLPVNWSVLIAVLAPVVVYLFLYKTVYGYEMRAAGSNAIAAANYGIRTSVLAPLSLVLGGVFAGIAGGIAVGAIQFRLVSGMQSDYGQLGVIIALAANGNPIGLVFSALFISVIEIGSSALQTSMGVPSQIGYVVEAVLVLFILVGNVIQKRRRK